MTLRPPPARRAAALSLIAAMAVLGCASLVKEPGVSLVAVELHSIGLSGATVRVDLDITNPNGFKLDARAMDYTLAFAPSQGTDPEGPRDDADAWETVATGRTTEALVVPARDSARVSVDVPFRYREVGRAVASLLQEGALHYRFHGAFTVGSPVGELRIPFDQTGLLDP